MDRHGQRRGYRLIKLIDDPEHPILMKRTIYQSPSPNSRPTFAASDWLERDKIADELNDLSGKISEFLDILASKDRVRGILADELKEVHENFANDRRTTIEDAELDTDIEDLIQREDMIVTVTHGGYVKRVPLSTYRAQKRGGKGRAGMSTRDEDFVSRVYVVNTHTPVLFFSSKGMVYKMKVYRLPLGTPQARGKLSLICYPSMRMKK